MIIRRGLLFCLAAAVWAQTAGIEGTWQGTIEEGAVKLRLAVHVKRGPSGEYSSTLDSIDQGVNGILVKATTFSGNRLHLEFPTLAASYDGTLSSDGLQISGTFTQGAPLPLTWKRLDVPETVNRPQNPKPPFPYDAVEVTYENKAGGVKLAGTLTRPRGVGRFPAAIMITGSGPEDRDYTVLGHKPFWVIADYLSRRGIAVLRVDDRGVGGSTGDSMRATLEDQAGDVLAGVEYLKSRPDIDPRHIGVIGHSEGGIIGPVAASRSPSIGFVIMLAGPGVPGMQVLRLQEEMILRAAGADEATIARNRAASDMIVEVIQSEPDNRAALAKIRSRLEAMRSPMPDAAIQAQIAMIRVPETQSMLAYDPTKALRKLKIPVLAIIGSRDVQVPASQNLPAISAALTAAGNRDFTVKELPGLNHMFQRCNQCTVAEYSSIEETFSPAALEVIGDWLAAHTR
jgi:pimeloyl-ACP methyl ester carboxylesterase